MQKATLADDDDDERRAESFVEGPLEASPPPLAPE
jgi:hypothetical protein